jgi:hypothetical protein
VVGTRNVRLLRRGLAVSIGAVFGLIVAAPLAAADPCPPLDLGCVVDDTTTTVGGVVDGTTTTVGEVVDDTTTTAGEVVDDTTTTVGGVLDDTTPTVGSGVAGAGPVDAGTIVDVVLHDGLIPGAGVPSDSGGSSPAEGTTPPTGGGAAHPGTASSGSVDRPRRVDLVGSGGVAPVLAGHTPTTVGRPSRAFFDGGLPSALLVRTLAFPLALIVLVIGFVIIQNRIDRKDPKLALAPAGSDYLTFS